MKTVLTFDVTFVQHSDILEDVPTSGSWQRLLALCWGITIATRGLSKADVTRDRLSYVLQPYPVIIWEPSSRVVSPMVNARFSSIKDGNFFKNGGTIFFSRIVPCGVRYQCSLQSICIVFVFLALLSLHGNPIKQNMNMELHSHGNYLRCLFSLFKTQNNQSRN